MMQQSQIIFVFPAFIFFTRLTWTSLVKIKHTSQLTVLVNFSTQTRMCKHKSHLTRSLQWPSFSTFKRYWRFYYKLWRNICIMHKYYRSSQCPDCCILTKQRWLFQNAGKMFHIILLYKTNSTYSKTFPIRKFHEGVLLYLQLCRGACHNLAVTSCYINLSMTVKICLSWSSCGLRYLSS